MTEKVDAFVGGNNQPQHLAVLNEHKEYLPEATTSHRAVCGGETTGQTVATIPVSDAKFACKDCAEQFKLWKEIHS